MSIIYHCGTAQEVLDELNGCRALQVNTDSFCNIQNLLWSLSHQNGQNADD